MNKEKQMLLLKRLDSKQSKKREQSKTDKEPWQMLNIALQISLSIENGSSQRWLGYKVNSRELILRQDKLLTHPLRATPSSSKTSQIGKKTKEGTRPNLYRRKKTTQTGRPKKLLDSNKSRERQKRPWLRLLKMSKRPSPHS